MHLFFTNTRQRLKIQTIKRSNWDKNAINLELCDLFVDQKKPKQSNMDLVNNFEFSLTEDWLLITIDFSSSSIGAAASNSLI